MKKDSFIFKDGTKMPRLGMGTWHYGENRSLYEKEKETLRTGLDNGLTLIDTAEMYGDGKSEELIGEVIKDYDRSKLFLVSKVLPWNAGYESFWESLNGSLERLQTNYLDLYLLHWPGEIPLKETVRCMEEARKRGLIKNWGVSNFDVSDMKELLAIDGGENCMVDQCLYHLGSRGVEFDLLPYLKEKKIGFMAYCPLAQAGRLKDSLLRNKTVNEIADKYKITPIQLLLCFSLRNEEVISIPKCSHKEHLLENIKASKIEISDEDWKLIDKEFPSPKHKLPLDMD